MEKQRTYDIRLIHASLKQAGGPAPWYMRHRPTELKRNGRILTWNEPDPDGPFGLHTVLADDEHVYAVVKSPTFAVGVEGNRLLLAHPRQSPATLVVHLIDADQLRPLVDAHEVRAALDSPEFHFFVNPEVRSMKVLLPRRIQPGLHMFRFPSEFNDISEFLLVGHLSGLPNTPEEHATALFAVNPILNQLQIVGLDWFNHGDYRHGTQWITRAAREPLSGRIVGEGIRVGQFVLSEAGDTVEEWLVQDDQFMP